jgi:glutamate formiminotransferase
MSATIEQARSIAASVRSPHVRALGLSVAEGTSQVSMNLIEPEQTGLEAAYATVARQAESMNVSITGTEIVGLVERRFLPGPDATVTRLLLEPGHCLEDRLLSPN